MMLQRVLPPFLKESPFTNCFLIANLIASKESLEQIFKEYQIHQKSRKWQRNWKFLCSSKKKTLGIKISDNIKTIGWKGRFERDMVFVALRNDLQGKPVKYLSTLSILGHAVKVRN